MIFITEGKTENIIKNNNTMNIGIVRNRLKIEATITNAQAYLRLTDKIGDFSDYLWQFVQGKPIINHWATINEVPASTNISDAMSIALKKMVLNLL